MSISAARITLKRHWLALKEDDQNAIMTALETPEWVALASDPERKWSGVSREALRNDQMADLWDLVETETRGGKPHPNPWL
jgi:hypothetical protein